MTGYEDYNYPAFNRLEQEIKELDPYIVVINPTQTGVQEGWTWQDYLAHDLKLLLDGKPDLIVTLPDWERSKGARLEVHVAKELGIPAITQKHFIAELRGNIFKRPTALYRQSDYSVFSVSEYEEAQSSLEFFSYQHDEDAKESGNEQEIGQCPLRLIELPITLKVEGISTNHSNNEEYVDFPQWIRQQVEGLEGEELVVEVAPAPTDPSKPHDFDKWLNEQ